MLFDRQHLSLAAALTLPLALFDSGCASLTVMPPGPVTIALGATTGRVLVNRSQEYVIASEGLELQPDDRVIAMEGTQATIIYTALDDLGQPTGSRCQVDVPENSLLVITGSEDCKGGTVVANVSSSNGAQGEAAAAEDSQLQPPSPAAP